jgi:hypothetical protein
MLRSMRRKRSMCQFWKLQRGLQKRQCRLGVLVVWKRLVDFWGIRGLRAAVGVMQIFGLWASLACHGTSEGDLR